MKVLFIGCNPSLKNIDPKVPFEGTRSGKALDGWIAKLGLSKDQVSFMNLTKYATQNQAKLKKSDVNLDQFRFELGLKLIAAEHGEDRALSMIISMYQSQGKLDLQALGPNPPEQVEADLAAISSTPLPKVVVLGEMASWGLSKVGGSLPHFKLPHPSGLNHKLNDTGALENTLANCKDWLYS
jgi:uracil-DNA glycosylase